MKRICVLIAGRIYKKTFKIFRKILVKAIQISEIGENLAYTCLNQLPLRVQNQHWGCIIWLWGCKCNLKRLQSVAPVGHDQNCTKCHQQLIKIQLRHWIFFCTSRFADFLTFLPALPASWTQCGRLWTRHPSSQSAPLQFVSVFFLAKTFRSRTENDPIYTKHLFESFPRLNNIHKPGRKRAYRLWASPISAHLQFCDLPRVRKWTSQTRLDMPRGNNCDWFGWAAMSSFRNMWQADLQWARCRSKPSVSPKTKFDMWCCSCALLTQNWLKNPMVAFILASHCSLYVKIAFKREIRKTCMDAA